MATIKPTVPYRTAIAERGKFWEVDDAYLASIGYPASGEGKYAILTYSINADGGGSITGSSGGAIEDGVDNLIKATVDDLTNSNPLATMIVDGDGDQITNVQTLGIYYTSAGANLLATASAQTTTAGTFPTNTVVRIKSYGGDNWVQIGVGAAAVVNTGMLLLEGDELTLIVPATSDISTVGGNLNIVAVGV